MPTLSSHKALGPNGFNTDFIKRCWPIICQDFYPRCNVFYDGQVFLQSINDSFITLIQKKDDAEKVSDLGCLLNTSIKIITKNLANKLQIALPSFIHKNSYRFIKLRSIQGCLAWSLKYVNLCHQSKRELIVIKLFEKAFDKVEHHLILQIMEKKRFSNKMAHFDEGYFLLSPQLFFLMGYLVKFFIVKGVSDKEILCHHSYLCQLQIPYKLCLMQLVLIGTLAFLCPFKMIMTSHSSVC